MPFMGVHAFEREDGLFRRPPKVVPGRGLDRELKQDNTWMQWMCVGMAAALCAHRYARWRPLTLLLFFVAAVRDGAPAAAPFLFCVLSCPVSVLSLSFPVRPVLSCPALPCPALPCPVLFCLVVDVCCVGVRCPCGVF